MDRRQSTDRVPVRQLTLVLARFQSAYHKNHSTETALYVCDNWPDMLMAADAQEVTLLGMLDLSAAFD